MILLEDQYELKRLVKINVTRTVEQVYMRTTVLREIEGMLRFFRVPFRIFQHVGFGEG